jgi:peroxiredoxin
VLIRPAATIKLLARSPKDEESRVAQTLPEPGQTAADFALPAGPDESVRLSDLRGRPVILAFYPADWSPVCSDQMALYALVRPEFDRYNAALLGISTDGVWCHRAFAEQHGINFPLLADFEPKGDVARRYGAYVNGEGVAARAGGHRPRGQGRMELPLAAGRQPGCRRHPGRTRRAGGRPARQRRRHGHPPAGGVTAERSAGEHFGPERRVVR